MGKNKVAIVKGNNPWEMVKEALRLIEAEAFVSPDDRVLIKPNYVSAKPPSTGVTTDPRVVETLIEFFKERGVKDITVGEGGSGDTRRAFGVVGIKPVVERHSVKLVDLNRDERVLIQIPESLALKEIYIARTVLESTSIINVPSLKVHHMAGVTLSMKNLMGAIIPKDIMHDRLHEKIVDLAKVIKPRLNVIDGIVGCERDEVRGDPVEMGVIVAGSNMVAVDAVGASIMGIDSKTVGHISLAERLGMGTADFSEIEILGTPIEKVRKRFRR